MGGHVKRKTAPGRSWSIDQTETSTKVTCLYLCCSTLYGMSYTLNFLLKFSRANSGKSISCCTSSFSPKSSGDGMAGRCSGSHAAVRHSLSGAPIAIAGSVGCVRDFNFGFYLHVDFLDLLDFYGTGLHQVCSFYLEHTFLNYIRVIL